MATESGKQRNVNKTVAKLMFWRRGGVFVEPDLNVIWLYMLSVFAVLGASIVALHFILYLRIERSEIFQPTPRVTPLVETISREELNATLHYFRVRAEEFERLKAEGILTSDPAR